MLQAESLSANLLLFLVVTTCDLLLSGKREGLRLKLLLSSLNAMDHLLSDFGFFVCKKSTGNVLLEENSSAGQNIRVTLKKMCFFVRLVTCRVKLGWTFQCNYMWSFCKNSFFP